MKKPAMKTAKKRSDAAKRNTLLMQVMRVKGFTPFTLGERIEYGEASTIKFLQKPEKMDGETRKKMASAFQISIDRMDDICNGKVQTLIEALEPKKVKKALAD